MKSVALYAMLILMVMPVAGQAPRQAEIKPRLIDTLRDLISFFNRAKWEPELGDTAQHSLKKVEWLLQAATVWNPEETGVGGARTLLPSLERMLQTLKAAAGPPKPPRAARPSRIYRATLHAVEEDLDDKVTWCRARGLNAQPVVEVKTLKNGVTEVRGLEVWYLEKFLSIDPKAAPHRFATFSSPAVDDKIPPGRFFFWSRNPAQGKTGEKVERPVSANTTQRVSIEVLTP